MNKTNQATLLATQLELEVLKEIRPRTPEQHRALRGRLMHCHTILELLEYLEQQEPDREV